ncbi:hypothetical protein M0E87_12275 [Corynebacterium sp. CCM 9185]|uniref:Uncharacterized protein n=1 Tax=Corynebacterium marambiense TaxID=2765364 RepID=A0ABS0VRF7_9CORY|nr:hypothetical protein [Corynebacterium marambiense]MBI8999369.1 hypothetical protein [Corynebacterium marambiense]MCK7664419.1 hypothetical protein [Corynebacterium marambiense]
MLLFRRGCDADGNRRPMILEARAPPATTTDSTSQPDALRVGHSQRDKLRILYPTTGDVIHPWGVFGGVFRAQSPITGGTVNGAGPRIFSRFPDRST